MKPEKARKTLSLTGRTVIPIMILVRTDVLILKLEKLRFQKAGNLIEETFLGKTI